jgi:hypothetical protein
MFRGEGAERLAAHRAVHGKAIEQSAKRLGLQAEPGGI